MSNANAVSECSIRTYNTAAIGSCTLLKELDELISNAKLRKLACKIATPKGRQSVARFGQACRVLKHSAIFFPGKLHN